MQNLSIRLKGSSFGLLLFFLSFSGIAQSIDLSGDLKLAESVSRQRIPSEGKRSYIYKNQPKTFRNYNPVSLLYGGSLYVYQNLISPHFSADCLYEPSCSEFSKLAVREYGVFKGGLLSFDRLSRCNRIAATDLDPAFLNKKTHRFSDSIKKYK